MSSAATSQSLQLPGATFNKSGTVTYDTAVVTKPTLSAAKTGSLTTRTDANTGTLTMDSGHGITTGAKVDIYWENSDGTNGCQYDVTVGTVATNSVPIDLGAGDDLPVADTDVTVMVQNVETISVTGDNIGAIGMTSPTGPAHIKITESDGTLIARKVVLTPGDSYIYDGQITNPAAGVTAAKVVMTHGRTVSETPVCGIAYT